MRTCSDCARGTVCFVLLRGGGLCLFGKHHDASPSVALAIPTP